MFTVLAVVPTWWWLFVGLPTLAAILSGYGT